MKAHPLDAASETIRALRRTHPAAPARAVLDLAMREAPSDWAKAPVRLPPDALAVAVAEVFDPVMNPAEWEAFTCPKADEAVRDALLAAWQGQIWPRFVASYCGTAGPTGC